MPGTISFMQQSFPGKPAFTEKDIPDLKGKVTIVTGSNTGLGKEIAQILYSKNAKVYVMARSESKTKAAIKAIKATFPNSTGELIFLHLDLADLNSIKKSAQDFLARESKLHVLFNNAGVGFPEKGSKTKQGLELQLGVNCIGSFALTKHLTPTLINTAKTSPANSVRVIWISSSAAEGIAPSTFVKNLPKIETLGALDQYCISKLGNYLHAAEFAARHTKADGVLSFSLNPGNLDSDFWRSQSAMVTCVMRKTLLHPPVYGAYTALFAGFSSEAGVEKSGSFIAPWGRLWSVSREMRDAVRAEGEGGTGIAREFWAWSEGVVEPYC